jgi:hypothetical protein
MHDVSTPKTRAEAVEVVHAALSDAPIPVKLYGSWARGDFHFDHDHRSTFSDLDLQGGVETVTEWQVSTKEIGERLRVDLPMRVSIRRADVHDQLSLPTSAWVALATYAACLRGPTGDSPEKKAYLAAKVLLLLHRQHVEEPLGSVVARLDSEAAALAYRLKTGENHFSTLPPWCSRDLLDPLPVDQQRMFTKLHESPALPDDAFADIRSHIDVDELARDTIDYILYNMRHGK